MKWNKLFSRLPQWRTTAHQIEARFSQDFHGDFDRWQQALDALPILKPASRDLGDVVTVEGKAKRAQLDQLRAALMELHPWRKGPFNLFGVEIDCEWRSNWKWHRVAPHIGPLNGATILDVGSGNGYYGWRMLQSGAKLVVGVDPTVLFCMQHLAVNRYLKNNRNWVVPLKFEELPGAQFDVVFSMGVLYHQRDPHAHLQRLFDFTKPGGRVVVESLVVRGVPTLHPTGRYARMGNVHAVPSTDELCDWLRGAGFEGEKLVDVSTTTIDEQRSTSWMRFESLAEALDPDNPTLTLEGYPAPTRGVAVAAKPKRGNGE